MSSTSGRLRPPHPLPGVSPGPLPRLRPWNPRDFRTQTPSFVEPTNPYIILCVYGHMHVTISCRCALSRLGLCFRFLVRVRFCFWFSSFSQLRTTSCAQHYSNCTNSPNFHVSQYIPFSDRRTGCKCLADLVLVSVPPQTGNRSTTRTRTTGGQTCTR